GRVQAAAALPGCERRAAVLLPEVVVDHLDLAAGVRGIRRVAGRAQEHARVRAALDPEVEAQHEVREIRGAAQLARLALREERDRAILEAEAAAVATLCCPGIAI